MRGIRGRDAGRGMVLVLSVLNRVYNFERVFPKKCAGFVRVCSNYKQGVSCTIDFFLVGSCPKKDTKIEGVVLNRVCILGIFCPKQGQGFKPSAAHLYPNIGPVPLSPLPQGRKASFKGEALRLLRTSSCQTNFEQNIKNFETRLIERLYPVAIIVRKYHSEVKFADRKTALQQRNKSARKKPLLTQYHPALPSLKKILTGKWHLIQNQQQLREIFKESPLISYRKGKSLKDLLVRAKL